MQDKENISEIKTGNQHIIQNKELNIFEALIPVVLLMCMLAYNIFFADGELLGEYSNQFILLTGGFFAAIVGFLNKVSFSDEEMKEIAAIVKLVISHTQPGVVAQGPNAGKPSKIAYKIDAASQEEATSRVKALLTQFPLYPELDLDFLKQHFAP